MNTRSAPLPLITERPQSPYRFYPTDQENYHRPQSYPRPQPTYPVKFRKMVGAQFKARNIELILNEIVESFPESDSGEVGLKSGQKIHTDLIVSLFVQMQPDCSQPILSIRYEHRDRDQTQNSLRHPSARTSLPSRSSFVSPPSSSRRPPISVCRWRHSGLA
jgi:hypothetical protein